MSEANTQPVDPNTDQAFDQLLICMEELSNAIGIIETPAEHIEDILETFDNCRSDMTFNIEWQDQHGKWHHYQTIHNEAQAYRLASKRYDQSGTRHRITDKDGRLMDVIP